MLLLTLAIAIISALPVRDVIRFVYYFTSHAITMIITMTETVDKSWSNSKVFF